MKQIIVFANQKGGVGKTTSAMNLGAYLALSERKVLLIDFDPQGNLSSNAAVEDRRNNVYDLITGHCTLQEAVRATAVPGLNIIPSSADLIGANVELIDQDRRDYFLQRSLADVDGSYDYILIDSPPSLGILTLNGLTAATSVLIPLQCEYFAMEGLAQLLRSIQLVRERTNPHLRLLGILFTMYDTRTRLAHDVVHEVVKYFGDRVFRTIVPRNVRLSEADVAWSTDQYL